MAREAKILTVFVASPKDVADDRATVVQAITEFNMTWGPRLGIYLDVVRWETHTYPGIGVDAQDVINRQIEENYDIFIGILWQRFGTPTGRAGSGTEEEFNRAFARHKEQPGSVHIMFYFNMAPCTPRSVTDADQLGRVFKFKESLGEKGVYYWEYAGSEEFAGFLRIHLAHHLQSLVNAAPSIPSPEPTNHKLKAPAGSKPVGGPPSDQPGDEGMMDLIEEAEGHFADANRALQRMFDAQEAFNSRIHRHTEDATVTGQSENLDSKSMKRVINAAADTLEVFAVEIESSASAMIDAFTAGTKCFSAAIPLAADFGERGKKDVEAALAATRELRNQMTQMGPVIKALIQSVENNPRATTAFNRAKKRTTEALRKLDQEMDALVEMLTLLERTAEETLANWPGSEGASDPM
jgi:hypothetical protein